MTKAKGAFGQQGLTDSAAMLNMVHFVVQQVIANLRTGIPVKVVAVHGGGIGSQCTVDLQPLVKQADGTGKAKSHGTIYGIPVLRNQGGDAAIVNDPKIGDVGYLNVADRDISSVKANSAEANPGSRRHHNLADGVYVSAMLNKGALKQYLHFKGQGTHMVSGNDGQKTYSDGHMKFWRKQGKKIYIGADPDQPGAVIYPASTAGGDSEVVFIVVNDPDQQKPT